MTQRYRLTWMTLPLLTLLMAGAHSAQAQVFGMGPSDPSQFTNGVFNLPDDGPIGSSGNLQQLNVFEGGDLQSMFRIGSGSEVNFFGGTTGRNTTAASGSEVNLIDGSLDLFFIAEGGSQINISGGSLVGASLTGQSGSEINVSGGELSSGLELERGGLANISGGNFTGFAAEGDAVVNLFATGFTLDGEPIADLVVGQPLLITQREAVLAGTFEDGTAFSFGLTADFNSIDGSSRFSVADTVSVNAVLVPEPASLGLLAMGAMCLLRRRPGKELR